MIKKKKTELNRNRIMILRKRRSSWQSEGAVSLLTTLPLSLLLKLREKPLPNTEPTTMVNISTPKA